MPWYRRSDVNSVFVIAGWFLCAPLVWTTCILVLTGEIYQNKYDYHGNILVWSKAIKVVAVVILALNLIFLAYSFVSGVMQGMK